MADKDNHIGELNIKVSFDIDELNKATKKLQDDLLNIWDSIENNLKNKSKSSTDSAKSDLDSLWNTAIKNNEKLQKAFSWMAEAIKNKSKSAANSAKTDLDDLWNSAVKSGWKIQTIINKIKEYYDRIKTTFKSTKSDLDSLWNTAVKSGWTMQSTFSRLWVVLAWVYAWIKSMDFLWKSHNKAIEENSQYERLYLLLNNTVGATREHVKVLNDQAKALEKVWVVSAWNITQVQSQLATFDLSIDTIERMTPAILNYVVAEKWARATTDDFKSATNSLAQALNWNFQSLTAVWFVLDEATKKQISNGTEMERANAIVSVLDSTYRWFNESLAQTDEWKIINLQNRFEMLQTSLWTKLIPVFSRLIDMGNSVLDIFKSNAERTEEYTKKINDNKNAQAFLNKQLEDGKISQEEYAEKMDLLKTKHEEFSSKLKNVWKDIVSWWNTVINKIKSFFDKYWDDLVGMVKNTYSIIWDQVKDLMSIFWDLLESIKERTWSGRSNMELLALWMMKLVQSIGIWVKTISTIFKTFLNIATLIFGWIVETFIAAGKSIDEWWNIVKTWFIGVLKTMVDVVDTWADTIGQIYGWMAEAIIWVFKGLATNVGVAVKKAVNLAVSNINSFIGWVNKIPWVNIWTITWFWDVDYVKFELGIWKNIEWLKKTFNDFTDSVSDNFDWIWASWDGIKTNFSDSWKNIEMVWWEVVAQIWDDWKELGDDIIESNNKIDNAMYQIWETTWNTTTKVKGLKEKLWWWDDEKLGDKTIKTLDSLNEKLKTLKDKLWWVEVWSAEFKKLQKEIQATEKEIKKYTDTSWKAWEKLTKEQKEQLAIIEKAQKKLIDNISDKYKQWQSAIKNLDEAQKKLSENNLKYNESIKDSLRWLQNEVKKTYSEYEKAISDMNKEYWELQEEITKDTGKSLAERNVIIEKELLDLEKELLEIQQERISSEDEKLKQIEETKERMIILDQKILQNTDKTTEATKLQQILQKKKLTEQLKVLEAEGISIDTQNKLLEIDEKKIKLRKELDVIQNNASADELDEARRIAGLSESELIIENNKKKLEAEKLEFENKVKLEKDKFEAEKESLLRSQEIYNYFLNKKKLDQEDLEETFSDERFKNLTAEEQELIVKLAREKIELTNQKNAIIDMQKEIKKATIDLSYEAFNIQKENIWLLKDEYKELIAEINNAINIQKEFMSKKSTDSNQFASGGYTGDWWIGEVAWVVHKGERVAPAWMVKQLKPLFANLENTRTKWFSEWGYTNSVTKNQTNNITVQNQVDLKSFLDYAKWKL